MSFLFIHDRFGHRPHYAGASTPRPMRDLAVLAHGGEAPARGTSLRFSSARSTPTLCTPMHGGAGPPTAEGTSRTVCRVGDDERELLPPGPEYDPTAVLLLPVSEVVSGSYFVSSDPA